MFSLISRMLAPGGNKSLREEKTPIAIAYGREKDGARGGTRTPTGCPTCPSNMRVCQFHHPSTGIALTSWLTVRKHTPPGGGWQAFCFANSRAGGKANRLQASAAEKVHRQNGRL